MIVAAASIGIQLITHTKVWMLSTRPSTEASLIRYREERVEPINQDCKGDCLAGYLWASEHAVNDDSLCNKAPQPFWQGCHELLEDVRLDQVTD